MTPLDSSRKKKKENMSHLNWKSLTDPHRRRLEYNAQILQQRRPELFRSLGNLREYAHHVEIIEEDGNLIAARSHTQESVNVLLPQEQGSTLIQQQRTAFSAPFERGVRWLILSGIGVGHSLLMAQALAEKYPTAGFFAWEPNPYAWTAFLALFDARRVVENTEHIFLFAGETIHAQAGLLASERRLFLFPAYQTAYLLGILPTEAKQAERYIEQAKSLAQELNRENAVFEPVAASFFNSMKTPLASPPRSVWSCTAKDAYIHFPIVKAFLEGFEQLGMSAHLEPFDRQFGRSFEALGKLFERQPDLLFSINAWPTELLYDLGLQKEMVESFRRPRVCWMVDDALLFEDAGPATQPGLYDLIFCCDRVYLPRLHNRNYSAAFLPHAALFHEPGKPREEYRAEISYVGSLPNVQRYLNPLPVACREMLERMETIRRADFSKTFTEILDSLQPDFNQRRLMGEAASAFCQTTSKGFTNPASELEYFLYNTATFLKRLEVVRALLPVGLRVYGPSSWTDVLPEAYKNRYGGFVDFADLADCYASSKICLNIHSHQCPTCLNNRDFDVPMAGSVILGDHVEDAERGFLSPGEEMLIYRTLDEAAEIARRYLNDADALEAVRARAQERVKREHTFAHRARTVLQAMEYSL